MTTTYASRVMERLASEHQTTIDNIAEDQRMEALFIEAYGIEPSDETHDRDLERN